MLTLGIPPEFLRSPRAAFGGCSPHAPEGAVSRPPSGATLPPGEGIGFARIGCFWQSFGAAADCSCPFSYYCPLVPKSRARVPRSTKAMGRAVASNLVMLSQLMDWGVICRRLNSWMEQ